MMITGVPVSQTEIDFTIRAKDGYQFFHFAPLNVAFVTVLRCSFGRRTVVLTFIVNVLTDTNIW